MKSAPTVTDANPRTKYGDAEPGPKYFPGWTMVGLSAVAQFMSAPGQSYSVAAFKEPMRESLEISETSFSLAYAFATIVSGSLLPWVGRVIDRSGARWTLPGIAALLGLACIGMSQVSSLGSLYIAFSCVRSLGQGALTLIAAWMVCEWFERRRGFATALSGLGGSISVMSIPPLNGWLIANYDWQTAWIVLAFAVWVGLAIPAAFLVRNRPEDLGLLPDGDLPEYADENTAEQSAAVEPAASTTAWSVADVMRDLTFWKLLSVPTTSGMVGTGLVFHAVSLLGSRGISREWALSLIAFQALIASIMVIPAGHLTDRYPARFLLAIAMAMLAIGGVTVLVMPTPAFAALYAIVLGLHGSILRSTGTVVWIDYYGRENQGSIRGIAMAVMIFAAAVGPLPLAFSIDRFGSYGPALMLFIAVPTMAAAMVSTAQPPSSSSQSVRE